VTTSPEEALLVLQSQFGDRNALEALLRTIRPSLLRYVRSVVGSDDAEDLTQDILFLIWSQRVDKACGHDRCDSYVHSRPFARRAEGDCGAEFANLFVKDWRRRPDLNRGWRFCRFTEVVYVVG
jgi:hypothetical protein